MQDQLDESRIAFIHQCLQHENWFDFVISPDLLYFMEHYSLEKQLEFANLIIIFYNLHLISEKDFYHKYLYFIEEHTYHLEALKEFM